MAFLSVYTRVDVEAAVEAYLRCTGWAESDCRRDCNIVERGNVFMLTGRKRSAVRIELSSYTRLYNFSLESIVEDKCKRSNARISDTSGKNVGGKRA